MEREVCCENVSELTRVIRKAHGAQGIELLLNGITGIDEAYLLDGKKWISFDTLLQLFHNVGEIYGNHSPKLFFELGKVVGATQSGALVTLAKWLASPKTLFAEMQKYNRQMNLDQEIVPLDVDRTSAQLLNYFYPGYFGREPKNQCEWTKGIFAGLPRLWNLPLADVTEVGCSFDLERVLTTDYGYLMQEHGQHVKMTPDGLLLINGEMYAKRVGLVLRDTGREIFKDVRGLPSGIPDKSRQVFTGEYTDADTEGTIPALRVERSLVLENETVINAGEFYNTPYCLYHVDWKPLTFWENVSNRTFGRARLYVNSLGELERTVAELTNVNQTLAEQVKDRTEQYLVERDLAVARLAELQRMQEQLLEAQRRAAVYELVAGVRHEMNTHLQTLLASLQTSEAYVSEFLGRLIETTTHLVEQVKHSDASSITQTIADYELLLEEMAYVFPESSLDAQLGENLNTASKAAVVMKGIIDQLREASDTTNYDFKPAVLSDIITQTIRYLDQRIREKVPKVTIRTEYAPEVPPIPIDQYKLMQALTAQINNSLDAMAAKLSANGYKADESPELYFRVCEHEGMVEVMTRDNGVGIPTENLERIFTPFFSQKGPGQKGTGLGLHIVAEIIRRHGGQYTVKSEQGKYTEIYWQLPMVRSA